MTTATRAADQARAEAIERGKPSHVTAIKAAMSIAKDVAEGRIAAAQLDTVALEACEAVFGTVAGAEDALWPVQADVARQVLAAGGIPADELAEWLAVQRSREGVASGPGGGSWIEQALELLADDEDVSQN